MPNIAFATFNFATAGTGPSSVNARRYQNASRFGSFCGILLQLATFGPGESKAANPTGGGVIEACSDFIMPIVENIVGRDPLPGAREGGRVLLSALGDDAVVLGAVAAARKIVGRSPFKKRFAVQPTYSEIRRVSFGELIADLELIAKATDAAYWENRIEQLPL